MAHVILLNYEAGLSSCAGIGSQKNVKYSSALAGLNDHNISQEPWKVGTSLRTGSGDKNADLKAVVCPGNFRAHDKLLTIPEHKVRKEDSTL